MTTHHDLHSQEFVISSPCEAIFSQIYYRALFFIHRAEQQSVEGLFCMYFERKGVIQEELWDTQMDPKESIKLWTQPGPGSSQQLCMFSSSHL